MAIAFLNPKGKKKNPSSPKSQKAEGQRNQNQGGFRYFYQIVNAEMNLNYVYRIFRKITTPRF
jgi:hypothetical protein